MAKSGVPDTDFQPWMKTMLSLCISHFNSHYLRTKYSDESSLARVSGTFYGHQLWEPWMRNITKTSLVENACMMLMECASLAPDPRTFGSCYLLLTSSTPVPAGNHSSGSSSAPDSKAYVKEITVLLNEGALTLVEENNEADERIKFEDGNVRAQEVQQFCHDERFRQEVYKMIKTIHEQGGKLTGTLAPRAAKKPRRDKKAEAAEAPAPAAEAKAAGAAEAGATAVEAAAEEEPAGSWPAGEEFVLPKAAAPAKASALPLQDPMALLAGMKW